MYNSDQTARSKWFLNKVTERTGGSIQFEMHWAGELTLGSETLPAVRDGSVDLSNPPSGFFSGDVPLACPHELYQDTYRHQGFHERHP